MTSTMKTSIYRLYWSGTERDKRQASLGKVFSIFSQGTHCCQNNLNLCSVRRELAHVLSPNDFICQLPLAYNCMSLIDTGFDSILGGFFGSQ